MNEKFGMGAMGFGPLPGMTETMDFVKRAWSSFNLPSSMTPTLDVGELDKRISDLKTVEQWLSLNLGMLQSAIQGLEIQRGTIAALKAFGDAVGTPGALDAGAVAAQAMAAMGGAPATSASSDATGRAPRPDDTGSGTDRPVEASEPPTEPFSHTTASAIDPAAWWGLLQSQFSQVAQAAMAGASAMTPPPADTATRTTTAAKARTPAGRKPPARKARTPKPAG